MRDSELARFMAKVQINQADENACWLWTGALEKVGYGSINLRFRTRRASRVSYLHFNGDLPEGAFVCHTCDNKRCVNPRHLYCGDMSSNVLDSVFRGQAKRGEDHVQAKLTNEQVAQIKELYVPGIVTQKELSSQFGVDQSIISRIIGGRRRFRDNLKLQSTVT